MGGPARATQSLSPCRRGRTSTTLELRQPRNPGNHGTPGPRIDGYNPYVTALPNSFDIIIIGSGAGGGTVAHELAGHDARVLVLERGDYIPQEDGNRDPTVVWQELRYRTRERWMDADGKAFIPYSHYNVGGNSKFWGSALFRLRRGSLYFRNWRSGDDLRRSNSLRCRRFPLRRLNGRICCKREV